MASNVALIHLCQDRQLKKVLERLPVDSSGPLAAMTMLPQQRGGCSGGEGKELTRVWWPRPENVFRGTARWLGGGGGLFNVCLLPALLNGALM